MELNTVKLDVPKSPAFRGIYTSFCAGFGYKFPSINSTVSTSIFSVLRQVEDNIPFRFKLQSLLLKRSAISREDE